MNTKSLNIQTTMQGRESEGTQRVVPFARPLRSLNHGLGQQQPLAFGFAPLRLCLNVLFLIAAIAFSTATIRAQEVEDTIKIKTRVVFLDAFVKDKKTNLPISNLALENFQVLDNGKPRNISYFTREGEARKPLAMVLILDLREDGAGRFLKNPEILKSMEEQLAKLPPGDEVAIMAMNIDEDETRSWLTEFTNERSKIASALAEVRTICEAQSTDEQAPRTRTAEDINRAATAVENAADTGNPDEVVSTEVIKGRNGATITRRLHRNGKIDVERVSKDGKVTVSFSDIYDMASAIQDASRKAQALRPNSQTSVIWVSDGIAPIFFEDRDASENFLMRDNVIFNSLTVNLRTLFKFLMPIGKPIASWMGVSLYGSAKYLAEKSGGEAVKVDRVKDYGAGLARIMGNLTARYSLGFTLTEDEVDDGNRHALEVRVNAKDEKNKSRKLLVSSRQGYYMSTVAPKNTTSAQ
ncbi:MAG TPA: VWA domain-containing protein [Pyrinomonadaceae bacterium]